ncbi:CUB domain-containing protein [Viridibacillus arvi]|uniref:CUB domain-containing protein n=1 Tax=Viridibacillus arvi TaxID=263475 RepID=UPI003D01D186
MSCLNDGQVAIIKTAIELAKHRREEHEYINSSNRNWSVVPSTNTKIENDFERLSYDIAYECLNDFLYMLDEEMIKIIRTVMYIGKEEEKDYSINTDELFRLYFKDTSLDGQGYRAELIKGTEIDRLKDKMLLDKFLVSGLNNLFIN